MSLLYKEGYFISPEGKIINVVGSHIELVIKEPEKFGYTKEKILARYDQYHEPYNFEGKAREEILTKIIEQGWIRIRYLRKIDMLVFQLKSFEQHQKDFLFNFAMETIKGDLHDKFYKETEVNIIDLNGLNLFKCNMKDLASAGKIPNS